VLTPHCWHWPWDRDRQPLAAYLHCPPLPLTREHATSMGGAQMLTRAARSRLGCATSLAWGFAMRPCTATWHAGCRNAALGLERAVPRLVRASSRLLKGPPVSSQSPVGTAKIDSGSLPIAGGNKAFERLQRAAEAADNISNQALVHEDARHESREETN
jgi:hypothetical protein